MHNDEGAGNSSLMLTLDIIRSAHGRLLEMAAESVPDHPDYLRKVRGFVDGLVESGAYFDEGSERRAIQAYLDHWTDELANHATGEERADLARMEIRGFDAEALRKLQDQFVNPFPTLSRDLASLSEESQRSPTAVLKLLEDKAKSAGLRFQEGLIKEIASQVTNDPEGATLCEFCLWHLFEDAATRAGNKINRPKGEVTFSCATYLVDKAAELHQAQSERQRAVLMKALVSFGTSYSGGDGPRCLPQSAIRRLKDAKSRAFVLYGNETLDLEQFLVSSRMAFDRVGRGLVLVHEALLRRWVELATEIAARTERVRKYKQGAFAFVALVAITGFVFFVWTRLQDRAREQATSYASNAANQGALGSSQLRMWTAYMSDEEYQDAAESRREAGARMYSAAREPYEKQLDSSLNALKSIVSTSVDSAQARPMLNNAISAAIGFLAQVGGLGELPPYAKVVEPDSDPDHLDRDGSGPQDVLRALWGDLLRQGRYAVVPDFGRKHQRPRIIAGR